MSLFDLPPSPAKDSKRPLAERMRPETLDDFAGQEHILEQEEGKKRFIQVVMELSRAFALCAASEEAEEIRDDIAFFQAISAALNKKSGENRKSPEQIDAAIRQLVSKAITTDGQVIDVFTAAGLPRYFPFSATSKPFL